MDQDASGTTIILDPGHIVLHGDPAPPKKGKGAGPQFLAHVYCGQTVAHLSHCYFILGMAPIPHWWTDFDDLCVIYDVFPRK